MTRRAIFTPIPDVIAHFLASNPGLEELNGAIWGDDIDPRCTPEQRQALVRARLEAMRRGK